MGARGLLLDLDGTLVITEHLHFESTHTILKSRGAMLSRRRFNRYLGWSEAHIWRELISEFDLQESPDALASERSTALEALLTTGRVRRRSGARDLLKWASGRGIPMAIASSLPRRQIDAILQATALAPFVGARFSGHDDVCPGRGKPEPDVYLIAAASLGISAHDCVAVEDSPVGIASALAAGCYTIAVAPSTLALPETMRVERASDLRGVLRRVAELTE